VSVGEKLQLPVPPIFFNPRAKSTKLKLFTRPYQKIWSNWQFFR